MKKYKVFLTMEFTAEVEAANIKTEEQAVEFLVNRGISFEDYITPVSSIENIELKRYWGGGKEMMQNEQK